MSTIRQDIGRIKAEGTYADFIQAARSWVELLYVTWDLRFGEDAQMRDTASFTVEELRGMNDRLYGELRGAAYETSFANPAYAVARYGRPGTVLSAVYARLRAGISSVYDRDREGLYEVGRLLKTVCEALTGKDRLDERIRRITKALYDADMSRIPRWAEHLVCNTVEPDTGFAKPMLAVADIADERYLYRYGLNITDTERTLTRYIAGLPADTVARMAGVFVEGYRKGFEVTGRHIETRRSAEIRYPIGFERVIIEAMRGFRLLGLEPVIGSRAYSSTSASRQYDYDHKNDRALYLDDAMVDTEVAELEAAFARHREAAAAYGGPAVMEDFGEEPFSPVIKNEAVQSTASFQAMSVRRDSAFMQVRLQYIKEEERSYTIISYPTPEIAGDLETFGRIFEETIALNCLDYERYKTMQQAIIDVLDTAEYVTVTGAGANRTNLRVSLKKLSDPARETKFENCVADVNIPVGECFTSPVLLGTTGTLHVSRVFLEGLEYRDLAITLTDGWVTDYHCGNFSTDCEGRAYIKDNVLAHHDTLPLGEFAIGTNTTAYAMARRYDIERKLDILIAEKTGPHFALGDTCYSHCEDIVVYNPDGKEIVAKDNEASAKRDTDPESAYFNQHIDITIPYDEIALITAVRADGESVPIIRDGRFAVPGCEELNEPLINLQNS